MKKKRKINLDKKRKQDHTKKLKLLMSVLLVSIKKQKPIFYTEVQKKAIAKNCDLGKRMDYRLQMWRLLRDLNDLINCSYDNAPPISAIVIRKAEKTPGIGIDDYPGFANYADADEKVQMRKATRAQKKVYDYGYSEWKKIYTELFR